VVFMIHHKKFTKIRLPLAHYFSPSFGSCISSFGDTTETKSVLTFQLFAAPFPGPLTRHLLLNIFEGFRRGRLVFFLWWCCCCRDLNLHAAEQRYTHTHTHTHTHEEEEHKGYKLKLWNAQHRTNLPRIQQKIKICSQTQSFRISISISP
jgi:hypothetical protein